MKPYLKHYLHSHTVPAQFLRFATVGVKISVIDVGGIYLLPWLFGLDLYTARIFSLGAATVAGYLLNRYFTFGHAQRGGFYRQMAGHLGVHLAGGVINYVIFSALIIQGSQHLTGTEARLLLPLAAVWVGGMAGLTFNFAASKRLVFVNRADNGDTAL